MLDSVKVSTNIPDFRRQLAALSQKIENRLVARALRAAGRVFRVEARAIAPKQSGALRRGIYVGRSRESRRGKPVYFVGVRASRKKKNSPFYWRFLEGGWIRRGPGQKITGGSRLKALKRARLLKAGVSRISRPFLAPAFAESKGRALDAFTTSLASDLAAEARK